MCYIRRTLVGIWLIFVEFSVFYNKLFKYFLLQNCLQFYEKISSFIFDILKINQINKKRLSNSLKNWYHTYGAHLSDA